MRLWSRRLLEAFVRPGRRRLPGFIPIIKNEQDLVREEHSRCGVQGVVGDRVWRAGRVKWWLFWEVFRFASQRRSRAGTEGQD